METTSEQDSLWEPDPASSKSASVVGIELERATTYDYGRRKAGLALSSWASRDYFLSLETILVQDGPWERRNDGG